jgi:hypothetical protein
MKLHRLLLGVVLVVAMIAASGCASVESVKATRRYVMQLEEWMKCQKVFVTATRPLPASCPPGGEEGVVPPPPKDWP